MRSEPSEASVATAPRWLLAVVIVLVVLPLGAAAAGQVFAVGGDYHAAGDLADIELHTRDVGQHQVELGQYSRGGWSHPGPALFYALALPYRLSGSSSIGINLGALLINGLSVVGILLLAHRRGGAPLLWAAAVGCALLLRGLGPLFLIEPWNPSVPVLPFGLFLFLVWEITCRGAWAIPVAAAVGTFCVQTHIGYVPLVLPLAALGVASFLWSARRAPDRALGRRSLVRSAALTAGVLGLMWLPPVVQELRGGTGNLSRSADYFLEGEGEAHTLADGYANVAVQFAASPEWISGHLELTPFTSEPDLVAGAPLPVLLVPFLLGALVWWRRRSASALRLVALTTVAAGLSVLAVSRTLGPIYHYRLGWTRVVSMAAVLSTAWALWTVVVGRWPRVERRLLVPLSLVALVAVAATGVPRFARSGPPLEGFSDDLELLAPELVRELSSGEGPVIFRCDGDEGCIYLAGLFLWFERHRIEAQVDTLGGVVASGAPHRSYDGGPVRAVLHVGLDAGFYARAVEPGTEVLTYLGDPPSAERARLGAEILVLDAEYQAGRLGSEDHFFARSDLIEQMGSGVGVVLEPFEV